MCGCKIWQTAADGWYGEHVKDLRFSKPRRICREPPCFHLILLPAVIVGSLASPKLSAVDAAELRSAKEQLSKANADYKWVPHASHWLHLDQHHKCYGQGLFWGEQLDQW